MSLCWDQICSDNPIVDDDSDENNVENIVAYFLGIAAAQVKTRGSIREDIHIWE